MRRPVGREYFIHVTLVPLIIASCPPPLPLPIQRYYYSISPPPPPGAVCSTMSRPTLRHDGSFSSLSGDNRIRRNLGGFNL